MQVQVPEYLQQAASMPTRWRAEYITHTQGRNLDATVMMIVHPLQIREIKRLYTSLRWKI